MGRAPCCEKMAGLNKGPWTPEEDQILIAHIQQHGHGNWRALPKQAGLLRCGKSCRLRWLNYLRPGIKRGNFSREEEETVINLHEMLGNRWSAMAARLPGRTDNEIKNVWNTHLKKRLKRNQANPETNIGNFIEISKSDSNAENESEPVNVPTQPMFKSPGYAPLSPQQSSSDFSAGTKNNHIESSETFPEIDEKFWEQELPAENSAMPSDFPAITEPLLDQFPVSPISAMEPVYGYSANMDDYMEFWYNLFINAEDYQNYRNSEDSFDSFFPGEKDLNSSCPIFDR